MQPESAFERIGQHVVKTIESMDALQTSELNTSISEMLADLTKPIDNSLRSFDNLNHMFYFEQLSLTFSKQSANNTLIKQCIVIAHLNHSFNRVICLLFYRVYGEVADTLAINIVEGASDLFRIEVRGPRPNFQVGRIVFNTLILRLNSAQHKSYNEELQSLVCKYYFFYKTDLEGIVHLNEPLNSF